MPVNGNWMGNVWIKSDVLQLGHGYSPVKVLLNVNWKLLSLVFLCHWINETKGWLERGRWNGDVYRVIRSSPSSWGSKWQHHLCHSGPGSLFWRDCTAWHGRNESKNCQHQGEQDILLELQYITKGRHKKKLQIWWKRHYLGGGGLRVTFHYFIEPNYD